MRQLGTIPDERSATRFGDYLLTLGIETRLEQTPAGFVIWVFNEDRLPQARQELDTFLQQPDDPRYVSALREADQLRRETARKQAAARRNMIDARTIWTPMGTARRRPLTTALILASVVVTLATSFGQKTSVLRYLLVSDFVVANDGVYTHSPFYDIKHGEVWRVLTPAFVHFDLLHLLFNMLWLYSLGGVLEGRYGTWRLGALVTVLAIASTLGEYLGSGSIFFGGMSGVVYGLFGFIWIKSRFDPLSRLFISQSTVFWMVAWFFLCMTGTVGHIANWAHGVGLVCGAILAYVPLLFRRR